MANSAPSHITPGDRVSIPYAVGRRTGIYLEDMKAGWIRVELDQTGVRVLAMASQSRRVTADEELAEMNEKLEGRKKASSLAEAKALGIDLPHYDHRDGKAMPPTVIPAPPLVTYWKNIDPRVRRRIERASRGLAMHLDDHVEQDRADRK